MVAIKEPFNVCEHFSSLSRKRECKFANSSIYGLITQHFNFCTNKQEVYLSYVEHFYVLLKYRMTKHDDGTKEKHPHLRLGSESRGETW